MTMVNYINGSPLTYPLVSPEAPKINPSYSVAPAWRIKLRDCCTSTCNMIFSSRRISTWLNADWSLLIITLVFHSNKSIIAAVCQKLGRPLFSSELPCHNSKLLSLWVSSETVLHPLCEQYTLAHLCHPLSCSPSPIWVSNHQLSWPPKQIVQQVLLPTILSP